MEYMLHAALPEGQAGHTKARREQACSACSVLRRLSIGSKELSVLSVLSPEHAEHPKQMIYIYWSSSSHSLDSLSFRSQSKLSPHPYDYHHSHFPVPIPTTTPYICVVASNGSSKQPCVWQCNRFKDVNHEREHRGNDDHEWVNIDCSNEECSGLNTHFVVSCPQHFHLGFELWSNDRVVVGKQD